VHGGEPTTQVLDLTPIDITTSPLHPLPVDEEDHLSELEAERMEIIDPMTAPIPTSNTSVEDPTIEPTTESTIDDPPLAPPADTVKAAGVRQVAPSVDPVETVGVRWSTRTCISLTFNTPGLQGKTYSTHLQLLHPDTHLSFLTHEAFTTPTDPQVLATIMTQLSFKAGLKAWGNRAPESVHSDMKQLHFRDTFEPKHLMDLNETQRRSVLESHMFFKEKRDCKIKGQTIAGGNEQRDYI
jgi:hypothetical protein